MSNKKSRLVSLQKVNSLFHASIECDQMIILEAELLRGALKARNSDIDSSIDQIINDALKNAQLIYSCQKLIVGEPKIQRSKK